MKILLYLGFITLVFGCTEEKSTVPKYQISFSEEMSLDFGKVGMSSQLPFSISPLDKKNESFLVFNTFLRRLDTVSFSPEKKRLVPGLEIPREGPGSIPSFYHFNYTKQRIIFFTPNEIFYLKDGETVHLKITKVLDDGSGALKAIKGAGRNGVFQVAPFTGEFLSVIIEDHETEKFSLWKYDFESFEEISFSFDSEQISKHMISFDFAKGTTVSNAFSPYLTLSDSMLIVSYPFMNKINMIELGDLEQSDFQYESKLFKTEKDQPGKTSGINDWEEFFDIKSKWDNDVSYDAVFRLNDKLMCRMVFESQQDSHKKFLELFDNSFDKVGEFDLTAIEPDLKWFHITVEGKILIQSSKDPDEDIFKYYLVSVDPI
ncbi:hypothetical protein SYJ56_16120 [Algoriphagus sp. D3-2-R+10]|uniref:hypothetical protein n=1 Tax=Algoriphagus aurantiacus TaxID=3103948 RepID=UPI002B3DFD8B|nr:hypothetical protein [Algoriphagus sp. D3-2-R+10]MEB2776854.1 hypothetical protein [Algoriphagus sp. D3-2-R+10]